MVARLVRDEEVGGSNPPFPTMTVGNNTVTFYWRPGCGFCSGLEHQLSKAGVALDKHNIWDDPKAAEFVRGVNRGNEIVPTVVVNGKTMTNPSAKDVIAAFA